MAEGSGEPKWHKKLLPVLPAIFLAFYPQFWLWSYFYFQCFLSSICPSLGIDIFTPTVVEARVSARCLSGALALVVILCSSAILRRYFFMVLPIWFFSINHICVNDVTVKSALEFACSRPINMRLASSFSHQARGCYFPNDCPGQLNTVIASYLRSKGERNRYAGVFPGFVCRLVVGETRETLKSYRVEAETGSDVVKLYCTQESMKNNLVVSLSAEQIERLRVALAALKPQESERELVPSPENIFLEYQILGQYFYMQNSGKGELAVIKTMLAAMSK